MLLSTISPKADLIDFTPDTALDIGSDRPVIEFRATLGEAMVPSTLAGPLPPSFETGQPLPLDGNNLPFDSTLPVASEAGQAEVVNIAAIAKEQTNGDEPLKVAATSIDLQTDTAAEHAVPVGGPIQLNTGRGNSRQPGDVPSVGRARDLIQMPLPPRYMQIFETQVAGRTMEQSTGQQVDVAARLAVTDQAPTSDARDLAKFTTGTVATNLRMLTEKFDVQPRALSSAIAQATDVSSASAVSLQGAVQTARVAPPPPVLASIDIPVQDDGWGEALNERVLWMSAKSIQRAEIHLNPANLGPIRVELSVADDIATVTFNAQHALTREAIDLAMPRLREMLGENGLSLANPDAPDADNSREQQAGRNQSLDEVPVNARDPGDAESTITTSLVSRVTSALVDTFV